MENPTENKTAVVNYQTLEHKINEWFLVDDPGIIRLVCATVIANRLPGDPVWLFLIAPPSGLKSELIRALSEVYGVYPLSSLTTHTLASGQKRSANETSLLLKIKSGIISFKDFTSVLELYDSARQEILSQLREVYDGHYAKTFGNGEEIKWTGKIGFIAGVTEAVDLYQGMYAILGERFVQYRMKQPDRKAATRRGMDNASKIEAIRSELIQLFRVYLDDVIALPKEAVSIPQDWFEEIIELSEFATRARSGVKRDSRQRDITHVFAPEMPIRFAKQLTTLAQAFMVMGESDGDRAILRKIAISSLPKNRIRVFGLLTKSPLSVQLAEAAIDEKLPDSEEEDSFEERSEWTNKNMAMALDLPTTTTTRILQDLNALGFITRKKVGKADTWVLKPEYLEFWTKYYPNDNVFI